MYSKMYIKSLVINTSPANDNSAVQTYTLGGP